MLEPRAELVLDAHADVGESPVWDIRASQLIWIDVTAGAIHRFDPASGLDRSVAVGRHVGAAALRQKRGLVLAVREGFALTDSGDDDTLPLAPILEDEPCLRMNDGKCDAAGRFWAGSMAYDTDRGAGAGALYRLGPDGIATAQLRGVTLSNGLDWSPDSRTLYYIDSPSGGVDAIDFDLADGRLGRRSRLVDSPDGCLPDGMTVDADGALWVAWFGGGRISRYSPEGKLDRTIAVPASQVTNCAFGGSDLKDLYITSAAYGLSPHGRLEQPHAGGLFCVRVSTAGREPFRYDG